MKRKVFAALAGLAALAAVVLCISSCTEEEGASGSGQLRLRFVEGAFSNVKASDTEVPDSNDFILEITGSDGSIVYSGPYGESPETITAPSGSCVIKVRSCEFSTPKFSEPQYGDDQVIVVPSGGTVDVSLNCTQLNCGIALKIGSNFLTEYPSGVFFVSSDDGKLMYSYSEQRIAYFLPGNISVILSDSGKETTLMTRTLSAREMLTVTINVSSSASAGTEEGITMQIDTTRIWEDETYDLGEDNSKGTDADNAMSVSEAKANIGKSGVWVSGYIVGGDLTSSSTGMSFSAPFSSATNLAIAARASVDSKSSCMSVQLPSGDVRDALNLVQHPDLLGRQVCLYGDITATYYGIVGLKNVSDYVLK